MCIKFGEELTHNVLLPVFRKIIEPGLIQDIRSLVNLLCFGSAGVGF